jgi:site-specific DNA-methyltransferase (adenine-specific)
MDIWKGDPINNFKTLLKNLDNDYIDFDNPTQKLINLFFANSLKDNKINIIMTLNDEHQELSPGKIKIKDINVNKKQNNKEIKISFAKDVLPYIIPLTCILTIKDKNKDFIHMLNYIKENEELLEIFDEQCLIWWDKTDLINIIRNITNEYFDKSSNVYNVSIQFKLAIQSLLDSPKELLELISNCLKPKTIEKKTFGEVFTPMNFINDNMLKDIEIYWLQNKKENIWENENLTWYDPAAGMGNYPIAIYYKLIEGLKSKIPNNEQRKKHIIEKQLYMGEINKKNCFIIKQIFNLNNEYELNLYEGNTLEVDIKTIFNIVEFNIIIGNPPYNEILTQVGAKPLYNKFIEFYMDKCDLLSFIVPSRWFAGGKGLNKFREMMINRTNIVYIKHYNDARKIFGNIVDIKGGVNYFLIDKDYNGLCDFNNTKVKLNAFDVILDSKYYNLISNFLNINAITKFYISQDYYKIQTNDIRLINEQKKDYLKCYVSQQKGFIKYIDKNEIKKETNSYKVITARAAFGANSSFGNIFIGLPGEVHTKSYISFNVNSENEAKSLVSYMKCKLPNLLLSLRKSSQDISESTCKWIPLLPLDKEWNDEQVYKYLKLSDDEIKLIKETKISGYVDMI